MKRLIPILALMLALVATGCSSLDGRDGRLGSEGEAINSGTGASATTATTERPAPVGAPDAPDSTTSPDTTARPDEQADPDLVWTVVAVERNDVLNVRSDADPSSPIVATLQPWTTDLDVLGAPEVTAEGTWRFVRTPTGDEGWVNGRFLVAQPADLSQVDRDEIVERSAELVRWATSGSDEDGAWMLADRALWVGGLGIYGDGIAGWNWFPSGDVDRAADWERVRQFELGPDFGAYECGADCSKSINEFIDFARIDDSTRYLVNDIPDGNARGFIDGALGQAPEALHRVVIDTPPSDPQVALDWQRIHVVFDWSAGEPQVLLLNTHGWTP